MEFTTTLLFGLVQVFLWFFFILYDYIDTSDDDVIGSSALLLPDSTPAEADLYNMTTPASALITASDNETTVEPTKPTWCQTSKTLIYPPKRICIHHTLIHHNH